MTLNAETPPVDFRYTFDDVFLRAAAVADGETVEEPRTWGQWFRRRPRSRWRPTREERQRAIEACRRRCSRVLAETGDLPTRLELHSAAQQAVGTGPLTILWVAVMVGRLLLILREWRDR